MKCPRCGADSKVLATRSTGEGYVLYRRRECGNAHRFGTHEVDDSMRLTIVKFAIRDARVKALVARARRWQRNAQIVDRATRGEKHSSLAAEFGLADNMVSTVVRKHK